MKNKRLLIQLFVTCLFVSSCASNTDSYLDYDANAQKFIDSAGIITVTEKTALITFVKQLKINNLWEKFKAIYPMMGGTANSMKWNLVEPQNSDEAFRLLFFGTPVFSPNGVLFPTASDYANTHLTDNAIGAYNNACISYYSLTQNAVNGYDMGCSDVLSPYNEFSIYNKTDATAWFGYHFYGYAPANTKGLFMISSTANDVKRYENGALVQSKGSPPVAMYTNLPILIGSVLSAPSVGQRQCGLATIGYGLTDAEALAFYKIVQQFENTLGR
jgi:hypothetical protein